MHISQWMLLLSLYFFYFLKITLLVFEKPTSDVMVFFIVYHLIF